MLDDDKDKLRQIPELFNAVKRKVTGAKTSIDNANQRIGAANTQIEAANNFFQELATVKKSMINSASKFAEYNIKVRALLRNIIAGIEGMNANLQLNSDSKELIDKLKELTADTTDTLDIPTVTGLTDLKLLPLFKYMNFNSALMGLIGAFLGNEKSDGKKIVGQIKLLLDKDYYANEVDVSYGDDTDNGKAVINFDNWTNDKQQKVIYNEVIQYLIDVSDRVKTAEVARDDAAAEVARDDAADAPIARPIIPPSKEYNEINAAIALVIKNTPNKLHNFNLIRKMIYLFCNASENNREAESQYQKLQNDIVSTESLA
jgi:hypothetical protein